MPEKPEHHAIEGKDREREREKKGQNIDLIVIAIVVIDICKGTLPRSQSCD